MIFWRPSKTEILLFGFAFSLNIVYVVAVQLFSGSAGFISHSDAEYFYFSSARNLVEHGVFSVAVYPPYIPDAYHTPLYSLFVAIFLYVKLPLIIVMFAQSFLAAGSALIAYKMGTQLIGSGAVAVIAALLVSIEPMSVYWAGLLMSDTLFGFLLALAMFLMMRSRPYTSAFVLGLAALTRPIALYFAPIYLCLFVYQMYTERKKVSAIVQESFLIGIIFVLTISPWLVRNIIVFGQFSMTSASWYQLYVAPIQEFAANKNIVVPEVHPDTPDKDVSRFDFKYAPVYQAAVLEVISHDPVGYLVVHTKRSLYSFVSNKYHYLLHVVLETKFPEAFSRVPVFIISGFLILTSTLWIAYYAFALMAVLDKRVWPWLLFLIALFGVNAGLSGAINPGGADMSRYNIGLYPLFFVFVVYGVTLVWNRVNSFVNSRQ